MCNTVACKQVDVDAKLKSINRALWKAALLLNSVAFVSKEGDTDELLHLLREAQDDMLLVQLFV